MAASRTWGDGSARAAARWAPLTSAGKVDRARTAVRRWETAGRGLPSSRAVRSTSTRRSISVGHVGCVGAARAEAAPPTAAASARATEPGHTLRRRVRGVRGRLCRPNGMSSSTLPTRRPPWGTSAMGADDWPQVPDACYPWRRMPRDVPPGLSPRQRTLLLAVCEQFVRTGDAPGSSALARRSDIPWSPATVRAELGRLVEAGLLWAPHASAARRPTDRGLQFYADHVGADPAAAEVCCRAIDAAAAGLTGPRRRRAVVDALGALLGGASVWAEDVAADAVVSSVHVLELASDLGRVIFELGDPEPRSVVFEVPVPWRGRPWVDVFTASLRWLCVGRTLAAARARGRELARREAAGQGAFAPSVIAAAPLAPALCGAALSQGDLRVDLEGLGRLARALSRDGGDVEAVVGFVEAKAAVAEVLERVAERAPRSEHGVSVCVGPPDSLDPVPPLSHVSLLARRVGTDAEDVGGVLGVLGPARMDFSRAVPLVEYAARQIASSPGVTAA
ncbi:MAG: hypothetical protein D6705_05885 [Deltaproteobacteria bacterium]|nr:MAG: hypothetical protein D6705_05885 [Deltaproteobacteria bacterium]